jgi:hypothetical protein
VASKAGEELAAEKATREKDQARVLEVEETLEGIYKERDTFQEKEKVASTELEKLHQAHAEVQSQAHVDREVLQQVNQIAAYKPFLLQCVFSRKEFVELTQLWRPAEAFADHPRSAEDVSCFYGAQEGHVAERAFWLQFQAPSHPELLNNQMK